MVAASNNKQYNPTMLATTTHPSSCQRLSYLLINPFIVNPTASSKLITNTLILLSIYKNNYHGRPFSAQQEKNVRSMAAWEEKDNVEEAIRVEEAVSMWRRLSGWRRQWENEKRKEDFSLQLQ